MKPTVHKLTGSPGKSVSKTAKQISAAVLLLLIILVSSAGTLPAPGTKEKGKKEAAPAADPAAEASASGEQKQCGVSNAQIMMYLQDCSHHHTVYWVRDIPGTCNSRAGIENCRIATVYVENGMIVGHSDSGYGCGGYDNSSFSGEEGVEEGEGPK